MAEQLVLGMSVREDSHFETYFDPTEGQLTAYLQSAVDSAELDRFVYLWGAPGVGKTHLLNACCQRASDRGLMAAYFDVEQVVAFPKDALDGLEAMDVVCLDNVQKLSGHRDWQIEVFNLYNRCRDNGHTRLIVGADASPTQLPIELPDLKSRFAWGASFKIEPLTEAMKKHLLQTRAYNRGFELSDSVIEYILVHFGRDMKRLVQLLDNLDDASLREHRKITIPFVKKILL